MEYSCFSSVMQFEKRYQFNSLWVLGRDRRASVMIHKMYDGLNFDSQSSLKSIFIRKETICNICSVNVYIFAHFP